MIFDKSIYFTLFYSVLFDMIFQVFQIQHLRV